jgi:excisionase family DNA binding protein
MTGTPHDHGHALLPGGLLAQMMTASEIASHLHLKRSTVEDYARRGLLPSLKLGRHRRFVRADVEEALRRLSAQPPRSGRGDEP